MPYFDHICIVLRVTCSPLLPTDPSPPRMLTMTGAPIGSTVELNWLPPLHPYGAIHYEIEYEPAMTPGVPVNAGSSSSPYFTLSLPNEFLTYNVRVAAVNTQGMGSAQSDILPVCLGMNREGVQYMIMAQCLIIMSCLRLCLVLQCYKSLPEPFKVSIFLYFGRASTSDRCNGGS